MSSRLAETSALYALAVAAVCAGAAMLGRGRSPGIVASLVLLELAAVLQAGLDAAGLARGHHPAEGATHAGYLVASLVVLPIALSSSSPEAQSGRWDAAISAVACVAMAVVALRVRATWSAHG